MYQRQAEQFRFLLGLLLRFIRRLIDSFISYQHIAGYLRLQNILRLQDFFVGWSGDNNYLMIHVLLINS